jgi:hypothetical protein
MHMLQLTTGGWGSAHHTQLVCDCAAGCFAGADGGSGDLRTDADRGPRSSYFQDVNY